nr:MAG TPA: hypothetical protein [Caudoviricetes sp.]
MKSGKTSKDGGNHARTNHHPGSNNAHPRRRNRRPESPRLRTAMATRSASPLKWDVVRVYRLLNRAGVTPTVTTIKALQKLFNGMERSN